MAQSRKRLFVVLVRTDICPHRDAALNIGELASKILTHALNRSDRPPQHPDHTYRRETVQQMRAYASGVLKALGKEPTLPGVSQDRVTGEGGLESHRLDGGFPDSAPTSPGFQK